MSRQLLTVLPRVIRYHSVCNGKCTHSLWGNLLGKGGTSTCAAAIHGTSSPRRRTPTSTVHQKKKTPAKKKLDISEVVQEIPVKPVTASNDVDVGKELAGELNPGRLKDLLKKF